VVESHNWPAYNGAQVEEKARFAELLADLCRGIPEPAQTFGRPRLPLADVVCCAAFKVYSTVSARRCMSDLQDAHDKGYISKVPHYDSIFNYVEMPDLTPILEELIVESSLPLKAIESDFAVDSSGFGTSEIVRWQNARYGRGQDKHGWIKVHLMVGVKTNVVTSIEITGSFAHDGPLLPRLVEATARNFQMESVLADKAYSSRKNLRAVSDKGATPYIPFRRGFTAGKDTSTLWSKLWHYYHLNRDDFLRHYHLRSNAESTFSMIKAKFGERLHSKTEVAQTNEMLLKVVCHNICCLIRSMHELELEPTFWANDAPAQKVP
jgi:transposase